MQATPTLLGNAVTKQQQATAPQSQNFSVQDMNQAPQFSIDNVVTPERMYQLVYDILIPEKRERSFYELSKKRESFPTLAPTLWYTTGVMSALLQEIISVYPSLTPAQLTSPSSNRVCNVLALFQSIASHPDTRILFINSNIPMYLYPFLNTSTKLRQYEFLRLTSLGVIGALVKSDDEKVIRFLLTTEIIPLCLRIMETGSELSRTVATFVMQKILMFPIGLAYICQTPDRFFAVSTVLANMVSDTPTPRLLKHIIRCYLRLSDHQRARSALKTCLPEQLRDSTFAEYLQEDKTAKQWLATLLLNLGEYADAPMQPQSQPPTGM